MKIFTALKAYFNIKLLLFITLLLYSTGIMAQTNGTAYWDGRYSTNWFDYRNWYQGKVPDANTAVIVGDPGMPGPYRPAITSGAAVAVYSLTIGGTGSYAGKLTVNNKTGVLTVRNDLKIELAGELINQGSDFIIGGNWENNATYSETMLSSSTTSYYPTVEFSGSGKTVGGTGANTFNYAIFSGNTILKSNITIRPLGTTLSKVEVTGTLDPELKRISFTSFPPDGFTLGSTAVLKVKAPTFSENYGLWPTVVRPTSIIDYCANGDQAVTNAGTYGILQISVGGTKTLAGNTTVISNNSQSGVRVLAGALDLGTFSLTRASSTGGSLTLAGGTELRIGGTGTFPSGFAIRNIASTSTVEYYGANQTVTAEPYGNLTLSTTGSIGANFTKTMPGAAMTIAGDFTSKITGTNTIAYTAGANITVNGDVTIGAGTTFGGGSRTITAGGNWTQEGAFAAGTSTVVLNGSAKQIIRTEGLGNVAFNNLHITAGAITVPSEVTVGGSATPFVNARKVHVNGNLVTSGAGSFKYSNGLLTMTGAAGNITGTGIVLNDLTIEGNTGTTATMEITGDLRVGSGTGKSFTATAGTLTMSGENKSIGTGLGSNVLTFYDLRVTGKISTASNFKVTSQLRGAGTLSATGGLATFDGATTFGGAHNLHDVSVVSGKSLTMAGNANMGVGRTLTVSGAMNVTANVPNTVTFNGTAAQSVPGTTFHHLVFDNTGAKTAVAGVTVNGNLTISAGSNLSAGNHTHTINGNWVNNGAFNKGAGTVSFAGASDATIKGITVFNNLNIAKAAGNNLILQDNTEASNLNFTTAASLITGANKITVTSSRTGDGWIYGTITRQHAFTNNTAYEFAAPHNKVTISSGATGVVTAVTVTNTSGVIGSFDNGGAINRRYDVSIAPAGTYAGTMQLQYLDADLNGSDETNLQLYRAASNAGPWAAMGVTTPNADNNWINKNSISDLSGSWTLSESSSVIRWTGAESIAWNVGNNWVEVGSNEKRVPGKLDIVEFGSVASVPNQPTLATTQNVKSMRFKGKEDAIKLTMTNSGSLTVSGNVTANESGVNKLHYINVNGGSIIVGGSLILNDGNSGNNIELNVGSGSALIAGNIEQRGEGQVIIGSGNLRVKGDYQYTSGTFKGGSGTVTYEGSGAQVVAPVAYHHLASDKPSGVATFYASSPVTMTGNLTVKGLGTKMLALSTLHVDGDVNLVSGTLEAGASTLKVKGNWNVTSGNFIAGTGTVEFTGGAEQTANGSTFNRLVISKSAGTTLAATGNIKVNENLDIQGGIVNLGTYTLERSAVGGTFKLGYAAKLMLSGSNFPRNFANNELNANSTVEYNASAVAQNVAPVAYGHLILKEGKTLNNPKKLQAATSVKGNFNIESTAILNGEGQTLTLSGDFYQRGIFSAGATYTEGTLVLASTGGVQKKLIGALTVNSILLEKGSDYRKEEGTLTILGNFINQGGIDGVEQTVIFAGDFINAGVLKSSGTNIYTGTRVQNISLNAPVQPSTTAPPTVIFDGTVSPVLNSTSAPTYGNLIIRNRAGVTLSANATVVGLFQVDADGIFNGGSLTHTFMGPFVNNGTVTSSGVLNFRPPYPVGTPLGSYTFLFGTSPDAFVSTGEVIFGGSKPIAFAGATPAAFKNVTIANTDADGVTGTGWNITGNLRIEENVIFKGGAGKDYTVGGSFTNNGMLQAEESAFTFTAASAGSEGSGVATISGSGSSRFKNVIIANDAKINLTKDITILGDLLHNGSSFTATSEISFEGALPSAMNAATGTLVLSAIKVDKAGAALTLGTNVTGLSAVTVVNGTLDVKTKALEVEENAIDAVLTVNDGAILKIGGSNGLPEFDIYTLQPESTVEYYGSSQPVKSVQYGHLNIINSGTKAFEAGTAKIAGSFIKAPEAAVVTPEAIEYNGAGNQLVAAINYNSLALSTGGTKVLASGTVGVADVITLSDGAGVDVLSNAATVDYNGAAAQQVLPANYYNLKLSNAGIKNFDGNVGVADKFIVTEAAVADLLTRETTIDFNGAREQNIPALAYKNLKVSASGVKTLEGNATVEKQLALTAGEVRTGAGKITLGTAEGAIAETPTAFVTGVVEITRDVPAGEEQDFGGLGLKLTPAVPAGITHVVRTTGTAVGETGNSIKRSFKVEPTANNGQLDAVIEISYFEHELNGNNEDELVLFRSANGIDNWQMQPLDRTTVNGGSNFVAVTGYNRFSTVTLGNGNRPLPVEFVSFIAAKKGVDAILNWSTSTELVNEGFEVQVSEDGFAYKALGFVNSRTTNSDIKQNYTYTDKSNGKTGTRYYRLRQVDQDGRETFFGPRAVTFEGALAAPAVLAYPNPLSGQLYLRVGAVKAGVATVRIYDAVGRAVLSRQLPVSAGAQQLVLDVQAIKQAGVYMLTVEMDKQVHHIKLMKQ